MRDAGSVQIHVGAGELIRFEGSTAEIATGAEGTIIAVTLTGGCEQRFQQGNAPSVGQYSLAENNLLRLAPRRPGGCTCLDQLGAAMVFGRLEVHRRGEQLEAGEGVHGRKYGNQAIRQQGYQDIRTIVLYIMRPDKG